MTGAASAETRALVAGWFSFIGTGATVGDLMAKDVVCGWLEEAAIAYDVALPASFGTGVNWREVDPNRYSHVLFVCGPFFRSDLLRRFERSRLIGVNLSMIEPVDAWNPFDLLLERDSDQTVRADVAFAAPPGATLPVIGFAPLPPADADRGRERADIANDMLRRLLTSRRVATVPLDTRLVGRDDGLDGSQASIESTIRRLDVVVTSRLHGLVLALRNGRPALALDPVAGGGKIVRQAAAVGWPAVMHIGEADDRRLQELFEFCLSGEAAELARERSEDAVAQVDHVGASLVRMLGRDPSDPTWGDGRRRREWASEAEQPGPARLGRRRTLARDGVRAGLRSARRAIDALRRRA